jgi:site-specific DNA-cytosine methylase
MRPRVIALENVEEFQTWGPLGADDRPCPERKGRTFQRWVRSLQAAGLRRRVARDARVRLRRANDSKAPVRCRRGATTSRSSSLSATHGAPESLAVQAGKAPAVAHGCRVHRLVASRAPSIFERKRPLAEATLRRIAKGVVRYVDRGAGAFHRRARTASTRSGPERGRRQRAHQCGRSILRAAISQLWTRRSRLSSRNMRTPATSATCPRTSRCARKLAQVKGGHFALVSAFLAKHYSGHTTPGWPLSKADRARSPRRTIITRHQQPDQAARHEPRRPVGAEPLHTISAQGSTSRRGARLPDQVLRQRPGPAARRADAHRHLEAPLRPGVWCTASPTPSSTSACACSRRASCTAPRAFPRATSSTRVTVGRSRKRRRCACAATASVRRWRCHRSGELHAGRVTMRLAALMAAVIQHPAAYGAAPRTGRTSTWCWA